MTAAMYGAPPPGRDRGDPFSPWVPVQPIPPAAKPFTITSKTPAEPDLAEHHKMSWNGGAFTWDAVHSRFVGSNLDRGWSANVFADGLRWRAELKLCGGKREATAETPAGALDAARDAWMAAVVNLAEVVP